MCLQMLDQGLTPPLSLARAATYVSLRLTSGHRPGATHLPVSPSAIIKLFYLLNLHNIYLYLLEQDPALRTSFKCLQS